MQTIEAQLAELTARVATLEQRASSGAATGLVSATMRDYPVLGWIVLSAARAMAAAR